MFGGALFVVEGDPLTYIYILYIMYTVCITFNAKIMRVEVPLYKIIRKC